MKIIVAPDSFKGSLTSEQVIAGVENAAKKNFPNCEIVRIPIADGGEGTVDAMVRATEGKFCYAEVKDPLGRTITAKYGIIHEDTAVIEMAAASGLPLLSAEERDLYQASSYGTGQLIKKVLDDGYRRLIIAIGGSATNDGGMGALTALGMEFLDSNGKTLEPVGKNLARVADYRLEHLCKSLQEAEITVMCDVDNPLLGPNGATYVYGPQKGGSGKVLEKMEAGMQNYADVILKKTGIALHNMPSAGAAGGIGGVLAVFSKAKLQSGIRVLLETCGFEKHLEDADLVITGEGHLDSQSVHGKVIYGIGSMCKRFGVPVIALVGGMQNGVEEIYDVGVHSVMVTVSDAMNLKDAIKNAEELLENAADRMFRMIRIGYHMVSVKNEHYK